MFDCISKELQAPSEIDPKCQKRYPEILPKCAIVNVFFFVDLISMCGEAKPLSDFGILKKLYLFEF